MSRNCYELLITCNVYIVNTRQTGSYICSTQLWKLIPIYFLKKHRTPCREKRRVVSLHPTDWDWKIRRPIEPKLKPPQSIRDINMPASWSVDFLQLDWYPLGRRIVRLQRLLAIALSCPSGRMTTRGALWNPSIFSRDPPNFDEAWDVGRQVESGGF